MHDVENEHLRSIRSHIGQQVVHLLKLLDRSVHVINVDNGLIALYEKSLYARNGGD
jgi:hypothetical protein